MVKGRRINFRRPFLLLATVHFVCLDTKQQCIVLELRQQLVHYDASGLHT